MSTSSPSTSSSSSRRWLALSSVCLAPSIVFSIDNEKISTWQKQLATAGGRDHNLDVRNEILSAMVNSHGDTVYTHSTRSHDSIKHDHNNNNNRRAGLLQTKRKAEEGEQTEETETTETTDDATPAPEGADEPTDPPEAVDNDHEEGDHDDTATEYYMNVPYPGDDFRPTKRATCGYLNGTWFASRNRAPPNPLNYWVLITLITGAVDSEECQLEMVDHNGYTSRYNLVDGKKEPMLQYVAGTGTDAGGTYNADPLYPAGWVYSSDGDWNEDADRSHSKGYNTFCPSYLQLPPGQEELYNFIDVQRTCGYDPDSNGTQVDGCCHGPTLNTEGAWTSDGCKGPVTCIYMKNSEGAGVIYYNRFSEEGITKTTTPVGYGAVQDAAQAQADRVALDTAAGIADPEVEMSGEASAAMWIIILWGCGLGALIVYYLMMSDSLSAAKKMLEADDGEEAADGLDNWDGGGDDDFGGGF